jgi:hypothetical protein
MIFPFFLETLATDFVGGILFQLFDFFQALLKIAKRLFVELEFDHSASFLVVLAPVAKPIVRGRVADDVDPRSSPAPVIG